MADNASLPYKRQQRMVVSFAIFLVLFHQSHAINATNEDYTRLLTEEILVYDEHVRPLINQSKAIDVYMTFNVLHLLDVQERGQRFILNVWVNFSWTDQLRNWTLERYGGVRVLQIDTLSLWIPQLIVTNSLTTRDVFADSAAPVTLFYNGASRWYPGSILELSCNFNMTFFPFDTQHCFVDFLAIDIETAVRYHFSDVGFNAKDYTSHGQWMLLSNSKFYTDTLYYARGSFTEMHIKMTFKRRPLFYVVNFLLPVMFMSFLCFFGFCVPVGIGERSSFSITVQLSLAVYITVVTSVIPATSDTFPILVYYIFSLLFLSGISVIVIVLQEMDEYRVRGGTSVVANVRIKSYLTHASTERPEARRFESDNVQTDNLQTDDRVSLLSSNKQDTDMAEANGTSNPDESMVDVEDDNESTYRSLSMAKDKACARLYAVAKLGIEFCCQKDILCFLLFACIWFIISIYFLNAMLVNYDKDWD